MFLWIAIAHLLRIVEAGNNLTEFALLKSPYYVFDDYGGYFGRFACPSTISTVQLAKEQRAFVDATLEVDCSRFVQRVLKNPKAFMKSSMQSHANQIRALSSLTLHSSVCEDPVSRQALRVVLEGFIDDPVRLDGYFDANNPTHHVNGMCDYLSKSNPYEQTIEILVSNDMKPLEYAIWARILLLLSIKQDDYEQVLGGIKDALKLRNGVNPTPDFVALLAKVYHTSRRDSEKLSLLSEHASELKELNYYDLLIAVSSYLEMTFDEGISVAEVLLGAAFDQRPTISSLFPSFTPRQVPYLLHAPLVDGDVEVVKIEPKYIHVEWTRHNSRRNFEVRLEGHTVYMQSSNPVSLFILRHMTGKWQVRDVPSGSCESLELTDTTSTWSLKVDCRTVKDLEIDDILVFVDAVKIQPDVIKNTIAYRSSLKETVLLLQSSLEELQAVHHVMMLI